MKIRGTTVGDRMTEHAVRRVFAESREVPLWDRLCELHCPVLVLRGGRRGSLLIEELVLQWRHSLPSVKIVTIEEAGHDLWSGNQGAYLNALLPFLALGDSP